MATSAIRCLRCGREGRRSPPICEDCERWLREAAELRKIGVVALKDQVTGDVQIKISRELWCRHLCSAIQELKPIKSLETNAGDAVCVENLLASIGDGSALRALQLPKTELTDHGLKEIRRFASLEVLNLSRTRISDDGLVHLAGLAKLSHLSLCGMPITAIGLEYLRALPMLKSLDIKWTHVDDAAFLTLAQMPELRHVDMRGTRVTFPAVKAFSGRRADVALDWVPTLKFIGCWSDDDGPFIHPRRLVDSTWAREDRARIVQYLSAARALAHAGGRFCRFGGCDFTDAAQRSDGVWLWSEGLAHYVQHHDVRLPEEFLSHMRNRGYCPSPAEETPIDFHCQSSSFWRFWCASQRQMAQGDAAGPV
jgi:hypothetical protein